MILPALRETDDITVVADPHNAAQMVLYMGTQGLPGVPAQKVTIDEATGEIVDIEPELHYVHRAMKELAQQDKGYITIGEIVYAGLQKASSLKEGLNDGIQLVVYRAYDDGSWIITDSGNGDDDAFRAWVKETTVPEGSNTTEATQLASTILNLCWLRDNGYSGLPKNPVTGEVDLELIFVDRTKYNRWRRVASPLRQLIQNIESGDEESVDEIDKLIQTVNDPSKGTEDLDNLRGNPRLPEAVLEIVERDSAGRHLVNGALTDAQLRYIRGKLKGAARFVLKGETYGVEKMQLVRYRRIGDDWKRQVWSPELDWSDWVTHGEPELNGYMDGAPLIDVETGVEYYTMWEKENELG